MVRSAEVFDVKIERPAAVEIAKRSQRYADVLRTVFYVGYAIMHKCAVTVKSLQETAQEALEMLQVDSHGLDHIDHKLITGMIEQFRGGPVGIDTIAASIGEESVTIEDVYEPYFIANRFHSTNTAWSGSDQFGV